MSKQKRGSGLTDDQKLLLQKNCSDQKTPRQMANFIHADYQKTYCFIIKNNLPEKLQQSAQVRKDSLHQNRSNVFHVSSRSNWLL